MTSHHGVNSNPPSETTEDIDSHLYAIWSADNMNRGEFEYRCKEIKQLFEAHQKRMVIEELEAVLAVATNNWGDRVMAREIKDRIKELKGEQE